MRVIFTARSKNGRWGLDILGPEETAFPAEGELQHLGKIAGVSTYVFTPAKTGVWVLPFVGGDKSVPHGGATLVEGMSLQGNDYVSLLALGQAAVVEHYGYKARSSVLRAYKEGAEGDVPPETLVALGLIQAGGKVAKVPPPPPMEGALAAAFRKAAKG